MKFGQAVAVVLDKPAVTAALLPLEVWAVVTLYEQLPQHQDVNILYVLQAHGPATIHTPVKLPEDVYHTSMDLI